MTPGKHQEKEKGVRKSTKDKRDKKSKKDSVQDERFTSVGSDPRFKRISKEEKTVEIDDRFTSMFEDPNFSTPTFVDKYGKPMGAKGNKTNLKDFYRLNKEAEDALAKKKKAKDITESEEQNSIESDPEKEDEDVMMEEYEENEGIVSDNIDTIEPTSRLALIQLDWEHIKAQDIFMLVSSFLPSEGSLKSVTVYLSEFGKDRLSKEMISGPDVYWEEEGSNDEEEGEEEGEGEEEVEFSSEEDVEGDESEEESDNSDVDVDEEGDALEGTDFDPQKLRTYELDKMKYFFGICVLDSPQTAKEVYGNLDGMEFELSSNIIDCRYVPDETSFDDNDIRDSVTFPPDVAGYEGLKFTSLPLQATKVKCTWDTIDPEREKLLAKLSSGDIDDNDTALANIVAPASDDEGGEDDESEEDEEQREITKNKIAKEKYRSLLLLSSEDDKKTAASDKKKEKETKKGTDGGRGVQGNLRKKKSGIVVEFEAPLESDDDESDDDDEEEEEKEEAKPKPKQKNKKEQPEDDGKTQWERSQEKRKQKRLDAKQRRTESMSIQNQQKLDEKAQAKKRRGRRGRKESEIDADESGELDLLTLPDEDSSSTATTTSSSSAPMKEGIDLEDPRFSSLLTSASMSIDKSDKAASKMSSEGLGELLRERGKARGEKAEEEEALARKRMEKEMRKGGGEMKKREGKSSDGKSRKKAKTSSHKR